MIVDCKCMQQSRISGLDFESLLDASVKTHGHLCPGQVLGVRMSMLGLREIGIGDPRGKDRKNLIAFVEIDRCATDAVQSVTGCSSGKRTLKLLDYGKMAATFVNLQTGKAVRVLAKEEAKNKAKNYCPEIKDKYQCQTAAYKVMPDDELFAWKDVMVEIPKEDMPGRPIKRVQCDKCGEYVQDGREVHVEQKQFCKACANGSYYKGQKT
jgi:formylmethanofuran dehydrogenase subunit E